MNKFTSISITIDPKAGHMVFGATDEAGLAWWHCPDQDGEWHPLPAHPGMAEGPGMFDQLEDRRRRPPGEQGPKP